MYVHLKVKFIGTDGCQVLKLLKNELNGSERCDTGNQKDSLQPAQIINLRL